MIKKLLLVFFAIIIPLFFFPFGLKAQEKLPVADEWIMDFKVNIQIQKDSSINVTEAITYNFGSNSKHGIYRDIPYKYRDEYKGRYSAIIKVRSVKDENGQSYPFQVSKKSGFVNIKIGDRDVLVTGIKNYIINYVAERELGFFQDHDELYWNVTGAAWSVEIVNSEAMIVLPREGNIEKMKVQCYTGFFGSREENCEARVLDNRTFYFKTKNTLPAFAGLTIVSGFEKGLIQKPELSKRIFWFLQDNFIFAFPLVVFFVMFYLWFTKGRDPRGRGTVVPQYEAPDNLTPGEVGAIVDEKADNRDVSATLIHLAIRGYLKIRAIKKQGIFGSRDYELIKLKNEDISLKPFERRLIEGIFGALDRRTLSNLKNQFYDDLEDVKKIIYGEITRKGYFPQNPNSVRNIYRIISILFIFFGVFISFGNFYFIASLIISGVIIFAFSFIMPRKTEKGRLAYEEVLGLKEFLSVTEKERLKFHNAPEKTPHLFEKFLPYAMVLGVEREWAEEFKDIYLKPPDWYEGGFIGPFNAAILASSLNSVASATTNVFVSRPGGSSGFGGGGGGFSGGGGGGGGGGSW